MRDALLSNPRAKGDTSAARGTMDARADKHPLPDRDRDLPVPSLPTSHPKHNHPERHSAMPAPPLPTPHPVGVPDRAVTAATAPSHGSSIHPDRGRLQAPQLPSPA